MARRKKDTRSTRSRVVKSSSDQEPPSPSTIETPEVAAEANQPVNETSSASESGGEAAESETLALQQDDASACSSNQAPNAETQGEQSPAPDGTSGKASGEGEESITSISEMYQIRLMQLESQRQSRVQQATELREMQLRNCAAILDAERLAIAQDYEQAKELLKSKMLSLLIEKKERLEQLRELLVLDESALDPLQHRLLKARRKHELVKIFGTKTQDPTTTNRALAPTHLDYLLHPSDIVEDIQTIQTSDYHTSPKRPRLI